MNTFQIKFELSTGFETEQECKDWFNRLLEQVAKPEYKKIIEIIKIK